MTDVTVTTEPPAPNTPEARTPDGTLKEVSPATTTPTSQGSTTQTPAPEPDGESFLTGKKDEPTEAAKTEDKASDPKAPTGAPEKYADFKLPDGYTFDDATLSKATELFKNNNLSQEQAQTLVDFYAENSLQAAEAPYKAWADLQKQWRSEITERFGGEDAARRVASDFASVVNNVLPPSIAKAFRTALDLTGAGSHPDVVEALNILFRPHREGTPVRGNAPAPTGQPGQSAPQSLAEAIYPHLRK